MPKGTKLTFKQKGFVRDYLETGNGVMSALKNYNIKSKDKVNVANVIAVENLRKPTIKEALASHARDAESMIYKLSQTAEAEPVRLGASKDILDRAGFKPIEKTESVIVNVNNERIKQIANKLNELRRLQP